MENTSQPLLLQLKGAPLSVLVSLATQGPQGLDELVTHTGWNAHAVRRALQLLVQEKLASRRHYRCWETAEGVDLRSAFAAPAQEQRFQNAAEALLSESEPHALSAYESEPGAFSAETAWAASWLTQGVPGALSSDESASRAFSAEKAGRPVPPNESAPDAFSGGDFRDLSILPPVESAPRSFSPRESASASPSTPHDDILYKYAHLDYLEHHHQHHDAGAQNGHDRHAILHYLQQLDPPFDNAAAWLQTVSPALVAAWLRHLHDLDRERRRRIRNQAAYIRAKVASGQPPPPSRRAANRTPCPHCGKTYFDAHNRCLVCHGAITL